MLLKSGTFLILNNPNAARILTFLLITLLTAQNIRDAPCVCSDDQK
jgi:hypothetical protein